jgi:Xaa-Pro aminopeptidase
MADHGYEKCCDWYLGHGLGTAHHAPLLSPHDSTVLQKNMVVVLNSLAQVEGENSYINEVMAVITDDGYELITGNPLGLVQL